MTWTCNRPRQWIGIFLLAMVAANTAIAWRERLLLNVGYGDFAAFYTSGLMLRQGQGASLYDRAQQWKLQQGFASGVDVRQGPLPLVRPPFEATIFLPMAFFSYPVALAIWTILKIVLLGLALRILPRPAPLTRAYPPGLELILCLGFFPVFLDLFEGQDAILLLFLVTASLRQLQTEKHFTAGLLLALGLFKFHLVLPLVLILCLAKHARILGGFMAGAVVLSLISLAITGSKALLAYPAYLLQLNSWARAGFAWPHSMPNLRGLLSPFRGMEWLAILVSLLGIALTIRIFRTTEKPETSALPLSFSLAVIVAVVTSYYAYSYDLTLLLVPILLLSGGFLDQNVLAPATRYCIVTALLLLLCAPLDWALLVRLDRGYLMVIPAILLALALAQYLRTGPSVPEPARRPA